VSTSDPQVHSISSVPANLAEDQWRRMRTYGLQMGTRLVLILAAALLAEGWVLWVCIAGAIVLPYTAVIFANAGRDRTSRDSLAVTPVAPLTLEAPRPVPGPAHRVVDHDDASTGDD
jgi:predicted tellurium resistance membrane protein TerC